MTALNTTCFNCGRDGVEVARAAPGRDGASAYFVWCPTCRFACYPEETRGEALAKWNGLGEEDVLHARAAHAARTAEPLDKVEVGEVMREHFPFAGVVRQIMAKRAAEAGDHKLVECLKGRGWDALEDECLDRAEAVYPWARPGEVLETPWGDHLVILKAPEVKAFIFPLRMGSAGVDAGVVT
jgi:hypothetical protein